MGKRPECPGSPGGLGKSMRPVHAGDGHRPRVLDRLRLSSYCRREQAQRGGNGRDKHACAHHGSHQAAKLPGRAPMPSEWIVLAAQAAPH
jgi:hypothetical protein